LAEIFTLMKGQASCKMVEIFTARWWKQVMKSTGKTPAKRGNERDQIGE